MMIPPGSPPSHNDAFQRGDNKMVVSNQHSAQKPLDWQARSQKQPATALRTSDASSLFYSHVPRYTISWIQYPCEFFRVHKKGNPDNIQPGGTWLSRFRPERICVNWKRSPMLRILFAFSVLWFAWPHS